MTTERGYSQVSVMMPAAGIVGKERNRIETRWDEAVTGVVSEWIGYATR